MEIKCFKRLDTVVFKVKTPFCRWRPRLINLLNLEILEISKSATSSLFLFYFEYTLDALRQKRFNHVETNATQFFRRGPFMSTPRYLSCQCGTRAKQKSAFTTLVLKIFFEPFLIAIILNQMLVHLSSINNQLKNGDIYINLLL